MSAASNSTLSAKMYTSFSDSVGRASLYKEKTKGDQ